MSLLQKTKLFETLEPIFKKINNENWDQRGTFCDDNVSQRGDRAEIIGKCCIGTHIAVHLYNSKILSTPYCRLSYSDGIYYVLDEIRTVYPEMTKLMSWALFHCAGSPLSPFSAVPWKFHPSEVLENMNYIETMPPSSCMYDYKDYYNIIAKEWLELERNRIKMPKEVKSQLVAA